MKRLIITLAAVATTAAAAAQQSGGLLMDKDLLMPSDMFELSQTQFNFGTARAMAMAGAFTSLGADLSSMSINPAGLGMYRHNDISVTPMMSFARSKTNAPEYGNNSRDRFSMANIGVVINAYEGARSLVSLNIGFGYNRIADLNYDYAFQRQNQAATIGDAYARQLYWGGISKNSFYNGGGSGNWNWNNIAPEYWNAALAYRGFLIDQVDPNKPDSWQPTWVTPNADVDHYTMLRSKGSIGEYVLSVGANINNKIYIGASLGIQSVYQRKYIDYVEEYFYSDPSQAIPDFGNSGLDYQLLRWKLNQSVIVDGTGVNFKAGVVYRPTANLRLGVAIHTPTYYSLDRKFQSAAAGLAYANNDTDPNVKPDDEGYISTAGDPNMTSPLLVDDGPNSWSFVSPTRLMFGASYTFGERGVISVDYERDWYNGIRIKDNPSGLDSQSWYNDTFRDVFKGSNILRVGAEFKPLPVLALRAGFGYSGSMLKDDKTVLASPAIKQTTYYGAGIGFVLARGVLLDVAYQYMSSKTTDYYLFYAEDKGGHTESAVYSTDINRHNVALTLGFRF
ncbi:outer membrane protein transport protein [Alistipes sp. kh20]|uniref:OmpP1/FadL family transporter n=1 Tax=Alistipes montrealensis TaxID=2834113 RepID=UPI001BD08C95|nr:outer membrane protein transport protein [Alistipes montrealensis]MBS4765272.1 outer membrane protein transport protein [Alistipes montrealensis]